jgi:hypothetical protein
MIADAQVDVAGEMLLAKSAAPACLVQAFDPLLEWPLEAGNIPRSKPARTTSSKLMPGTITSSTPLK